MNNTSPVFLPIAKSDEYLPSITIWTRLGGFFLVGVFGVVFTIGALTRYAQKVKAPATVRPVGELRIVEASMAGSVKNISVTENQFVQQGETIAIIDDTPLQTKKTQLQGNIQTLQLQLSQIDAQIRAIERQIATETERWNRVVASATAELNRTQRDYQDKKIAVSSEWLEAEANIKIAGNELRQGEAELKSAQANVRSSQAALKTAIVKRDRYQAIAESGSISQNQLEEAELLVTQQEQVVESQKATLEAQNQVILQKHQALTAAQARRTKAVSVLNPHDAFISIAQEKIASERAAAGSNLARLQQEREGLLQGRIGIQDQVNNIQQELKQISGELKKTIIRASETGTILKLELRNPGQVVNSGSAIAQISPSHAPLIIKARVSTADIGKVLVCDTIKVVNCQTGKVHLRFYAYPYPDYGHIKGAVRKISADAIPQNHLISSVAPYYEVTIEPEKLYLEKSSYKYPIQAGMEVTADIISKEETILRFLLRKARLITDL
ncbi:HlyD family efflux transporter periplasmic adaptor subunit [Cronbergia sp. UHCC 0137]|uniref:HlyD family efflux transporter periplasmic adaptor subunit n=1 Tax=Cronbergia sp. UHCC 0137 TaxID=3110239 RepID=UPI002B21E6EA|nr:HlyD family efflux transporter periplasmic adaptor subunit [Cronbergia sp. UHCC 0137]MEA5617252.1 HlyD family efflux transporter periplasmic adaptor subunit [Cronbergia sp. UHCC 0137]